MVDFRTKQAFYIGECWKNWLMPIFAKSNNKSRNYKCYL